MPTTASGFQQRLDRLKADLVEQGDRARVLIERAYDAAFHHDTAMARGAIDLDEEIDRVDLQIERDAVSLLMDATGSGGDNGAGGDGQQESGRGTPLTAEQVRTVLTIVKVNNELERIADCGVDIADAIAAQDGGDGEADTIPETFRVMSNSVIGILRDSVAALARMDPRLAQIVLKSETAVARFREQLIKDIEAGVASGAMPVDQAFGLHGISGESVRMADHCTNIAEQVLYTATGTVYRHSRGEWERVDDPASPC